MEHDSKFYQTTFKLVVLSEYPISNLSLGEIAYMVDEGDGVGTFHVSEEKVVSPQEMVTLLYDAGSEPSFFLLDEDGNPDDSSFIE
jgi:hypothetical protein